MLRLPSRRGVASTSFAAVVLAGLGLAGCSSQEGTGAPGADAMGARTDAGAPGDGATPNIVADPDEGAAAGDPSDQPLVGLSPRDRAVFDRGDKLFGAVFALPE